MRHHPLERELIQASQNRLVDFYAISFLAYANDSEGFAARAQAFPREGEPNPYYDWVLAH